MIAPAWLTAGLAAVLVMAAGRAACTEVTDKDHALAAALHPRSGVIELKDARARLDLGTRYDFLGVDEARRVLTEGWGNPPESAESGLGLISLHGQTFLDRGAWGAVVTYDQTKYVTDDHVTRADYDRLLDELRAANRQRNRDAEAKGFAPMELLGWAQPPAYDREKHILIWARRPRIPGGEDDTSNYDVRRLGRSGVLSLNIVARMSQIDQIRAAAEALAQTAEFEPGSRYVDHQSTDKATGYGLAGLISAGAGLAAAKNAGVLAGLVVLLKKGFVVAAAGAVATWRWLKGLFGRKPPALEAEATGDDPQSLPAAKDDGEAA